MEEEQLYSKYSSGRHWEQHPTVYAEKFVEFLKSKNFNGLIVDAGCSTGRDVEVFSKAGFNVVGIDISKEDIEKAKEKHLNCEIQNVEELKFSDESVDAVFMINVIHYVKKGKTLSEIYRVLKEKGYFFIHFNLEIKDSEGNIDYEHKKEDILKLVSQLKIVEESIFEREDTIPTKHTHQIMELILQK